MDAGDGSATFDTYAALERVDGLAVRTGWRSLEPARRSYDWSTIDAAAAAASRHGKRLGLHVIASAYAPAPDWLAGLGLQSYSYTDPSGRAVTDAVPWDGVFLSEWGTFTDALAAHLVASGAAARLQYISVAVPVPEMSLPGCAQGRVGAAGPSYDRDRYRAAWWSSMGALERALPGTLKLLPVPVATICRPDSDGPAFYRDVLSDALALPGAQVAAFATDLDAAGSRRLDGLAGATLPAPVAVQFLGVTGIALRDAVCAGRQRYGARLFEVYKTDLASTRASVQAGVAAIRDGCP